MKTIDLQQLTRPISKDLQAFDRKLDASLAADSVLISAVVKHILATRGKRLRPAVMMLSARSGGFFTPRLVYAALAVELIHTATLLHDDVVDESEIRRGQDTVNARWTNLVSVLMGDFLFSRAFRVMVDTESPELIRSLSSATNRVSYGELRQIEEMSNFDLPEKDYIKIIADKTASLFAVSCEAGAILKKASPKERRRYRDFGENMGIAFQIADDLLDYVGDTTKTGKQPGIDLMQGKVTLPLIHALDHSSSRVRGEMTALLNNGIRRSGIDRVLRFITEQGGIDYAYARASAYSARAAGILNEFQDTIYRQTLRDLVAFTVSRDN